MTKRHDRRVICVASTAVVLLGLAACSSSKTTANSGGSGGSSGTSTSSSSGSGSGSAPLVYNIEPEIYPYVNANDDGINAEAKKLGMKVVYANANGSTEQQVSDINDAISAGAKGIILQPNDSIGVEPAVNRATKAGICVVSIAVSVGSVNGVVYPGTKGYVGWNEHDSGGYAAAAMAKAIGGKGDVALLIGNLENGSSKARYQGAADELSKSFPGIHVVEMQQYRYDTNVVTSDIKDFLGKYGSSLKGIFVDTNPAALAAVTAIDGTPYKGKIAISSVGGESTYEKDINEGLATADVPELPNSEGTEGVDLVNQCISGNTKPVDYLEENLPVLQKLQADDYTVTKADASQFAPQW